MSKINQIILIDDEKLVHLAFKLICLKCGYDLISIYDYENALEYAKNYLMFDKPAAIFVDLMLGEMSGLDIIKQMRSKQYFNTIPVVLYTGHDFNDVETIRELNITGVLKKPCSKDEILKYIKI